jgi:hypothetical protein
MSPSDFPTGIPTIHFRPVLAQLARTTKGILHTMHNNSNSVALVRERNMPTS